MQAFIFVALLTGAAFSALACHRSLLSSGATRLEASVAAYGAAIVVPVLCATWVFMAPIGFRPGLVLGSTVAAMIGMVVVHRAGRVPRRPRPGTRVLIEAVPPLLVILAATLVALVGAGLKPMSEIDGLLYHGPAAANLVQHGSLFGWDSTSPWIFFPNLGAVLAAASVAVTDGVGYVDGFQALFLPLLGGVAWAWVGAGRPGLLSGAIGAAPLASAVVYAQARSDYVDVMFGSVVLAGVWLLWLAWQRRRIAYVCWAATFLAAAAATKPAGSLLVAVLALVVVLGSVIALRRRFWVAAAPFALVAAAGLPFYLRNLIEHGNPLYPVRTRIAGIDLPGLLDASAFYATSVRPQELRDTPDIIGFFRNVWFSATNEPSVLLYDMRIGGFGVSVIAVGAVAAASAVLLPRFLRRGGSWRAPVAALASALVILALQPQSWYPRYTIAAYALIVVAVGIPVARSAPPAVARALAAGLLVTWVALAVRMERHLELGIPSVRALDRAHPTFNEGLSGTTPAYQDAYAWQRGLPCGTRVAVGTVRGLQIGLLGAYNYGFWGDRLCNDVTIAHDVRGGGGDGLGGDRPRLTAALRTADFAVVFESDRELVTSETARLGRSATVVSDPPDFYGADQVVFRVLGTATEPAAS